MSEYYDLIPSSPVEPPRKILTIEELAYDVEQIQEVLDFSTTTDQNKLKNINAKIEELRDTMEKVGLKCPTC